MRQSGEILIVDFMVVVAQLVRAPGCGPGGRGFEPRLPPHYKFSVRVSPLIRAFLFLA